MSKRGIRTQRRMKQKRRDAMTGVVREKPADKKKESVLDLINRLERPE